MPRRLGPPSRAAGPRPGARWLPVGARSRRAGPGRSSRGWSPRDGCSPGGQFGVGWRRRHDGLAVPCRWRPGEPKQFGISRCRTPRWECSLARLASVRIWLTSVCGIWSQTSAFPCSTRGNTLAGLRGTSASVMARTQPNAAAGQSLRTRRRGCRAGSRPAQRRRSRRGHGHAARRTGLFRKTRNQAPTPWRAHAAKCMTCRGAAPPPHQASGTVEYAPRFAKLVTAQVR